MRKLGFFFTAIAFICSSVLCFSQDFQESEEKKDMGSWAVGGLLDANSTFNLAFFGDNFGLGFQGKHSGMKVENVKTHTTRLGAWLEYRYNLESYFVVAGVRGGGLIGKFEDASLDNGFYWQTFAGVEKMLSDKILLTGYLVPVSGDIYEYGGQKTQERSGAYFGVGLFLMI